MDLPILTFTGFWLLFFSYEIGGHWPYFFGAHRLGDTSRRAFSHDNDPCRRPLVFASIHHPTPRDLGGLHRNFRTDGFHSAFRRSLDVTGVEGRRCQSAPHPARLSQLWTGVVISF